MGKSWQSRAKVHGVVLALTVLISAFASLEPTPVAASADPCPGPAELVSGVCKLTFTEDGTFSVPAGITSIDILAVGGGGGGGGAYLLFDVLVGMAGGGGGGGEVKTCSSAVVTPSDIVTVIVGEGGSGGNKTFDSSTGKEIGDSLAGDPGDVGGASSVTGSSGPAVCSAKGGDGGGAANGNLLDGYLLGGNTGSGGNSGSGKVGGRGLQQGYGYSPGLGFLSNYEFFGTGGGGGGSGGDGKDSEEASVTRSGGVGGSGSQGFGGGGGGGGSVSPFFSARILNCGGSASDGGGAGGSGLASPCSGSVTGGAAVVNTGGGGGGGGIRFGPSDIGDGGDGGSGLVIITFRPYLEITVAATTDSKSYDGTTTSDEAPVTSDVLYPGDKITAASCPQLFDSPNAGPRTLSVSDGCKVFDKNDVDVTSFYTITTGSTAPGTITKATATCSATLTYNGDQRPVVCRGADGNPIGTTTSGGPHPTNVGEWSIGYTFTESSGNYEPVANGTATITIAKADPVCTVTGYMKSYDTTAHTSPGSCVGVKGELLTGLDLSDTTWTNVGVYPGDSWTFTDVTGNYKNASGTVNNEITKTQPMVTYTGLPAAPANGTLTLSARVPPSWCNGPVSYTITPNPMTGAGSLTVSASSVSTVGWRSDIVYTLTANYEEDANCLSDSDPIELVIATPAESARGCGSITYDSGRAASFRFRIRSAGLGESSTHLGELQWIQHDHWRVQARLDWHGTAMHQGVTTGVVTGKATVSTWEPVVGRYRGRWEPLAEDVDITFIFQPEEFPFRRMILGSASVFLNSPTVELASLTGIDEARALTGLDNRFVSCGRQAKAVLSWLPDTE